MSAARVLYASHTHGQVSAIFDMSVPIDIPATGSRLDQIREMFDEGDVEPASLYLDGRNHLTASIYVSGANRDETAKAIVDALRPAFKRKLTGNPMVKVVRDSGRRHIATTVTFNVTGPELSANVLDDFDGVKRFNADGSRILASVTTTRDVSELTAIVTRMLETLGVYVEGGLKLNVNDDAEAALIPELDYVDTGSED